jgi:uncharacterized protein
MDIAINNYPERGRYEATVTTEDGERAVAGFLDYTVQGRLIVLDHTEVDPAFEGRGIGSALARAALDDTRRTGRRAVPVCPFIRSWVDRHPDYTDTIEST